ncbi:hypothetical protein BDR07DRAFT_1451722 [Suillus spraguei]|nr:hypothetical protein BDR07DRAFT_1451722 [Suillus spraguei]
MKVFIKCLLQFECKGTDLHEGILGTVNAYYGCVEAQGRGTLHCHMLIWLEGALNPNEIKDQILQSEEQIFKERLLRYLEDTISTCIPELPEEDVSIPNQIFHPYTMRKKDAHLLAKKCQTHRHSKTCWKYWRGPPEPKECHFDLDEKNVHPISLTDPNTGEITLKCLDGLVNHFNASILEAMRCNMDIKFIGSGPASQLKTHIALAAMETAVHKLEKMLQKCAHSMISHQELSAQQVCSYLMDFEDHFTSHEYCSLYWTNFESFLC